MNKTYNCIENFKKLLITTISWTLLMAPIAVNAQESEVAQEQPQKTEVNYESGDYCYQDGSAKKCDGGLVYNCHLEQCVSASDNKNYNMEYEKCDGNEKCREDLKADAKEFTNHKTADPKNGKTDVMNYLSAASQIGMGCVLLSSAGCNLDGIGAMLTGALILASALMSALGSGYKKEFEGIKKELENIEKNDEKGWNHTLQKTALETEVNLLGRMEDAADSKIKHHSRVMVLITIALIIAGICALTTLFGCTASNPCTYWTLGLGVVALLLEQQAKSKAEEAKSSAGKAKAKTNAVLTKLKKRYNDQYNPASSRSASMSIADNGQTQMDTQDANNGDVNRDTEVIEELGTLPEVKVNMGTLGGNGENFAKTIGYNEIEDAYNKTRETKNPSYINEEIDLKAAKVGKAARRVLTSIAKSDKANPKAKKYINAILDPAGNKQFIGEILAQNVSPIDMALAYRKAGGTNAAKALEEKKAEQKGLAFDSTIKSDTRDYLKKLKAQLSEFDDMMDDSGALALQNYDPTVNQKAVDQLSDKNKSDKETIHPDSGLSLWKIITNRYNIIKLKKGF